MYIDLPFICNTHRQPQQQPRQARTARLTRSENVDCFLLFHHLVLTVHMIPARLVQDHLRDGQGSSEPIQDRFSDRHLQSQSSSSSTFISHLDQETTAIDRLSHNVNDLRLDQPGRTGSIPSFEAEEGSSFLTSTPDPPTIPHQPPYRSLSPSNKGKGRALDVIPETVDIGGMELYYRAYRSEEEDVEDIMRLVEQELSEP